MNLNNLSTESKIVRPVKLELEGFRSFKDKCEIVFESNSILLTGKRTDSSVTSGTGKSSIVQAIAFALGFCDLPATELKNWDSGKMSVKLTLSDGQNEYIVIRNPKLSLIINGENYVSQSIAVEQKIEDILKTPINIVEALTYRSQRSFGRFINSSDQYKKDFLASVLGLSELENASELVDNDLKNLEKKMDLLLNTKSTIESVISGVSNNHEELKIAIDQYEKSQKEYDHAKNLYKVPDELFIEMNQIKQEILLAKNAQNKINQYNSEISVISNNLSNIAREMQALNDNKCFTCNQYWSKSELELENKKNTGANFLHKKMTLQNEIPNLMLCASKLPELEQRFSQKNLEALNLSGKVDSLKQIYDMSAKVLKSATEKKNQYESNIVQKNNVDKEIHELQLKINKLKHVSNIFSKSGFMSVIFNNVLLEIEKKTNDFMESFDNINHFYLKFESTSVSKNGSIKKNIAINLYRQSECVSFKSLSGGQKCAVELCVDLAIAEIVKRRTRSPLGWIILDEAMDGLDVESKRAAIEAIKPKISGTMIIIDHATEIKESFDNTIEVIYDGKSSRIKT